MRTLGKLGKYGTAVIDPPWPSSGYLVSLTEEPVAALRVPRW